MTTAMAALDELVNREYRHGFVTDVDSDSLAPGLDEDVIRLISRKKNEPEFMLEWRLKAFRRWLTMTEPAWSSVHHPPIDYQDIIYYSSPKSRKPGPASLDEVDPELLKTYEKLGVPLKEREALAGVAVDAVDNLDPIVSQATGDGLARQCPLSLDVLVYHQHRRRAAVGQEVTGHELCGGRTIPWQGRQV